MRRSTDVVVIGAGQAGLATSHTLTAHGIDHMVLDRRTTASAWRHERWDSLRLLTPNWLSRLPNWQYTGSDPDGYMTAREVERFLKAYQASFDAPVVEHTAVEAIATTSGRYRVDTSEGPVSTRAVVLATGAASTPHIPELAASLPDRIHQVSPTEYRNPNQLSPGRVLVVGASASGVQIADELNRSGREVTICVGDHVRLPRTYRHRDIHWWMDRVGVMDEHIDQVLDPVRARRLPSLQLVGSPTRRNLDINELRGGGVHVVGRLVGVAGTTLQFAGNLGNFAAAADLKLGRFLGQIDTYVDRHALEGDVGPAARPEPTTIDGSSLTASASNYDTVIWATGFRQHHPWLPTSLLDAKGAIVHKAGVLSSPGLYVMGLPFQRRRKSSFLDGVADDAAHVTAHVREHLDGRCMAATR